MENFIEINYEKNMSMLSQAVKYCETNFLHEDLINELALDNELKKQLCIILISKLNSQTEANLLVSNLTGKSGPIREAASAKILDLISDENYRRYFQGESILDVFVKAITDINPSVSRSLIEIVKFVDNTDYLYKNLIAEINKTLAELSEIKQNKSYVANKKNFNLYWNLEAIISISAKINPQKELAKILEVTAMSNDYTIREKTAQVLSLFDNFIFDNAKNILKYDNNIYVKKYID